MNGNHQRAASSSTQPTTNQSKVNLLSTYLVSDEEDCEDSSSRIAPGATLPDEERIEVLTAATSTKQCDSTECDSRTTTVVVEPTRSKYLKKPINVWSDDTIGSSSPQRSQYRITFEIIKARTVTTFDAATGGTITRFGERRRYVNYTILIKRVPGLETKPAIIERRYSEFLNFYNSIKRKYPGLLKDIIFPKKILIGNFSPEVIAERSLAFQKFLTYCLSVSEIRFSREFATFLYVPELKETKKCLTAIHLEEAACILENVYFIQDKLAVHSGKPSAQLIHTMCCLIGCLNAVDNTSEARMLADRTFEILFENSIILNPATTTTTRRGGRNNESVYEVNNLYESSELVLPLILLSLRLQWFSGQRKIALENKLEELCRKRSLPRNFNSQPTLLEIILRRDFSPIIE